jgi:antitoxin component of RelBE/YafQ-DinJ toxin-antitoxin module
MKGKVGESKGIKGHPLHMQTERSVCVEAGMDCGDFKAIRMFARKLERTCVLPVDLKVSDSSTPISVALHCA